MTLENRDHKESKALREIPENRDHKESKALKEIPENRDHKESKALKEIPENRDHKENQEFMPRSLTVAAVQSLWALTLTSITSSGSARP